MAGLGRYLQVVRVEVPAIDDDDVLDPAGDKQFALIEESQVARTQERSFARIRAVSAEGLTGFVGTVPIARRHARTRDPYLTNAFVRTRAAAFRVHNHYLLVRESFSACDNHLKVLGIRRRRDDRVLLQRFAFKMQDFGAGQCVATGHNERGFRQSVTRIEGLGIKPTGGKSGGEALHGCLVNRFSAVKSSLPTAQVQSRALFWRDSPEAQLIRKIRTAGDG